MMMQTWMRARDDARVGDGNVHEVGIWGKCWCARVFLVMFTTSSSPFE